MKNKMKKIITGLSLAFTMMLGGVALTGCSSDITFNQKDLDAAINNVNEYLETQNNFSSEFARNTFNAYLMNAWADSSNSTSLKLVLNTIDINSYGDRVVRNVGEYKYVTKNNVTKELSFDSYSNSTHYRESVKDASGTYDMTEYFKEDGNKVYTQTNDVAFDEVGPLVELSGLSNYSTVITYIRYLLTRVECEDFIMETPSNNVVKFKAMAVNSDDPSNPTMGFLEFEFKDGKLTKFVTYNTSFGSSDLKYEEVIIEHNIADFTFDKTGYVPAV